MKILTAAQMREVDRLTTERYGIPSLLLMENAGSGVVREMAAHFGDLRRFKIAVLCGKGNNGGDGFVAARHLSMRGARVQVLLFASPAEMKGDARTNLEIWQKLGYPLQVVEETSVSDGSLRRVFRDLEADIVVDALLGTGARPPVKGLLEAVIKELQRFPRIAAVDIPSGLDCDAGHSAPGGILAARAELTVTFTAPKPAHAFSSGEGAIQRWVVIPIGTPAELLEDASHWLNLFDRELAAQALQLFRRTADSHKGSYGHVLVAAGSVGKTGAASMTAQSVLLAGAGLVTLATPAPCLPVIAAQTLEVMTEPLEAVEPGAVSTKAFDYGRVERLLEGKDVLALGPGLGTHPETVEFVRRLALQTRIPAILDADAINAFAGAAPLLAGEGRVLLLTPHPGEFARLLGVPVAEVLAGRAGLARRFAQERQLHLVLKGHRTIYASPSGQVYVNATGNPGMATGGSGDILTGILAGLLGQTVCRFGERAAISTIEHVIALGVYLHGLAGDLARERRGEQSLVASDIMACLSQAFLDLTGSEQAG